MALLAEAEGAGKILVARHISPAKFSGENNLVNATVLCYGYSLQPDFGTYFAALNPYAWVLWSCGLVVVLAICGLFAVTMHAASKHWKQSITNLTVVLIVYPIVAASAFIAIVIPRGRILAEAIAQEAVMIAMYQFFTMIVTECGGPDHLTRRTPGSRLETRLLPCCCWPCCFIPRPKLDKRSLSWLRHIIMQMPVVQALIYLIIIFLWAEDMMLYHRNFIYLQPFVSASILTGVWGMMMCVRMAESAGHRIKPRFLALQLVLVMVKLQCGLAKFLPEMINMSCRIPLNPSVFVNMIQNCILLLEMLLLSIWAWRLYRIPPGKDLERAPHVAVAVLEDSMKSIDLKPKDGIENKSFHERLE